MSLRAGALLGASAGALMGTVESTDVIGRYGELLFGPTAGILVVAFILAATVAAGTLLGLALGLAARLARRRAGGDAGFPRGIAAANRALLDDLPRDARTVWRIAFPSALLLAALLYFLSRAFLAVPMGAGRLAPYVLAMLGLAALGLLARWIFGPRRGRSAMVALSASAWSLVFTSAAIFALLYVIDRDYYAGFHPGVHAALAVAAFGCALALLVALLSALDPARIRFPRRIALGALGLWLILAAAAVFFHDANQDAKAFLHNRTTYAAPIYALLSPARIPSPARAAPARAVPPPAPSAETPDLRGANLVLITIEAARPDHMATFGSSRRTTPAIDHFARKCALFRRAYAQAADTFPSFASVMTGRHPSELEWRTPFAPPLPASNVTLAEILREAGYATAAVTSDAAFAGDGGLAQGFARHDDSAGRERRDNRGVVSDRVERNAEAMLGSLSPPFFFWAHFHDPHAHYMPRPSNRFGDRDVDRYDGELAGTDASVGRLLGWIRTKVKSPTIVVIASDHGEAFGEHGRQYHGATLYEESVHVPLLIRVPGWRGRSIAEPVRLVDLAPTALDLLRVPSPVPLSGRSLGPLLAGREDPDAAPVVVSEATGIAWKRMALAYPWKLIHDYEHDTWELYDLWSDPREGRNRYHLEPEVVRRLEPILLGHPGPPR
jgi:arylsulfatase A-like enzyme